MLRSIKKAFDMVRQQDVPIQTVSKYMGHSDSTVTLKVYSHFIPDTQDTALNALNNITAQKNDREFISVVAFGVRGGNRTHSLSLRRRLRYPITPREHAKNILYQKLYQFHFKLSKVRQNSHFSPEIGCFFVFRVDIVNTQEGLVGVAVDFMSTYHI